MNEPGNDEKNEPKGRYWWFLGFAMGSFVVILLLWLLLPLPNSSLSLSRSRELSKRAMCGANLNGIGKAILLYQYDHDDTPPPNLAAVVADDIVPAAMLICPSSGTEKSPTTQPADIAAHCDYIYAPLPADIEEGKKLVMAFELPVNHRQDTVNVLFYDYRVKSIQEMDRFVSLVQKLNDYHAGLRRAKP